MFSDILRFTKLLRHLKALATEIPNPSIKHLFKKIMYLRGKVTYLLAEIQPILKDFFSYLRKRKMPFPGSNKRIGENKLWFSLKFMMDW